MSTKHDSSGEKVSSEDVVVAKALVNGLIQGDANAWAQFIDQFGGLIRYRVADVATTMGRRKDWSTIDDITAEVFSALIANDSAALRAFQHRSQLSTYLSVIATRVARRMIRRVIGNELQAAEDASWVIEDSSSTTGQQNALSNEQQERLLTLVDQLPRAWRKIVILHYREGMTYQEISQQHAIPIGTIGTTLRRAEKRLKDWIEDEASS